MGTSLQTTTSLLKYSERGPNGSHLWETVITARAYSIFGGGLTFYISIANGASGDSSPPRAAWINRF